MMLTSHIVNIALQVSFSYFIKRAGYRLLFNFHVYFFIALFLTLLFAVVYFLMSPDDTQPKTQQGQQKPVIKETLRLQPLQRASMPRRRRVNKRVLRQKKIEEMFKK